MIFLCRRALDLNLNARRQTDISTRKYDELPNSFASGYQARLSISTDVGYSASSYMLPTSWPAAHPILCIRWLISIKCIIRADVPAAFLSLAPQNKIYQKGRRFLLHGWLRFGAGASKCVRGERSLNLKITDYPDADIIDETVARLMPLLNAPHVREAA